MRKWIRLSIPLPNHRSEIKLQIKENDVALLKELNFVGNHVFSKSKLQDQMELQPDAWWKLFGNKFDPSQFNKDLEAIQNYYFDHGYAKAKVTGTDVQLNDKKTEARVTINISEGDKYTVKNARILGDLGGMKDQLAPTLNQIHLDQYFRGSDVHAVENSIKSILGEKAMVVPKWVYNRILTIKIKALI